MSRDGHYIVSKSDSDKIDKAFDKMAKEIAELQRAKEELLDILETVVDLYEQAVGGNTGFSKDARAAIEAHK